MNDKVIVDVVVPVDCWVVGLSTAFRQLLYFSDDINSTIRLFADDSVVYRQINSPDDHRILQEDLQKLVEWSKPGKWNLMLINMQS